MQRQRARPTQTVEPRRYRSETAYQKPPLMQTPLHPILRLQRKASCACGGGCPARQAKGNLNISQPNDPAEIEADQIADKVMRMVVSDTKPIGKTLNSPNTLHRACNACEENEEEQATLQRKGGNIAADPIPPGDGALPDDGFSSVRNVINFGGNPLDRETRAFFEPRFGHDFGQVRVHTDARAAESARSVNALAYTVGRDVVFGSGQYAPGTSVGRSLLAHELTHVAIHDVGHIWR